VFAAPHQKQQEYDEAGQRQFAVADEGLGGEQEFPRGETLGNQLKKSLQNGGELA
jgi:hypothetical protein